MPPRSAPMGADRRVRTLCTSRADGDLAVRGAPELLAARRSAIIDRPWVWLEQVHGHSVLVVGPDDDPAAVRGAQADAIVTSRADIAIAVHSADCATVALWSDEGVIGVAHAGWRGLEADILGATVRAMRAAGAVQLRAFAGPSICPSCYEFVGDDLDRMVTRFGPGVVAATATGSVALDVRAAVDISLAAADVALEGRDPRCTSCDVTELWSHRARREQERQALVSWIEVRP